MAHTEPLGDDGSVASLPLRGEERKEGFAGDAERWWLAQASHGCLLDLIHEGDEVLMERAEGIDHEGRESRADVLRVSIVFEVFGSASALDGFARTAGAAEVGGGERVDFFLDLYSLIFLVCRRLCTCFFDQVSSLLGIVILVQHRHRLTPTLQPMLQPPRSRGKPGQGLVGSLPATYPVRPA